MSRIVSRGTLVAIAAALSLGIAPALAAAARISATPVTTAPAGFGAGSDTFVINASEGGAGDTPTPYEVTYVSPCTSGATQSCPFNFTYSIPVATGSGAVTETSNGSSVTGTIVVSNSEIGSGSGVSTYTSATAATPATISTVYSETNGSTAEGATFQMTFKDASGAVSGQLNGTLGTTAVQTVSASGQMDKHSTATLTIAAGSGALAGLVGSGGFKESETIAPVGNWLGCQPPAGFTPNCGSSSSSGHFRTQSHAIAHLLSHAAGSHFKTALHKGAPAVLIAAPLGRVVPGAAVKLRVAVKNGATCTATAASGAKKVALGSGVDAGNHGAVSFAANLHSKLAKGRWTIAVACGYAAASEVVTSV